MTSKPLLPLLPIVLAPKLFEIKEPMRIERKDTILSRIGARSSATDGELEGIVAENGLEAIGEVEGGEARRGGGKAGEPEAPIVKIGEENVGNLKSLTGGWICGGILVDLEAEDAAMVDGEVEEEGSGDLRGYETGGEATIGEGYVGYGERREGMGFAEASALAEGGLVAVAELVLLPGGDGGGEEEDEEEEEEEEGWSLGHRRSHC